MKLDDAEERDVLAAEYVLGTLDGAGSLTLRESSAGRRRAAFSGEPLGVEARRPGCGRAGRGAATRGLGTGPEPRWQAGRHPFRIPTGAPCHRLRWSRWSARFGGMRLGLRIWQGIAAAAVVAAIVTPRLSKPAHPKAAGRPAGGRAAAGQRRSRVAHRSGSRRRDGPSAQRADAGARQVLRALAGAQRGPARLAGALSDDQDDRPRSGSGQAGATIARCAPRRQHRAERRLGDRRSDRSCSLQWAIGGAGMSPRRAMLGGAPPASPRLAGAADEPATT